MCTDASGREQRQLPLIAYFYHDTAFTHATGASGEVTNKGIEEIDGRRRAAAELPSTGMNYAGGMVAFRGDLKEPICDLTQ